MIDYLPWSTCPCGGIYMTHKRCFKCDSREHNHKDHPKYLMPLSQHPSPKQSTVPCGCCRGSVEKGHRRQRSNGQTALYYLKILCKLKKKNKPKAECMSWEELWRATSEPARERENQCVWSRARKICSWWWCHWKFIYWDCVNLKRLLWPTKKRLLLRRLLRKTQGKADQLILPFLTTNLSIGCFPKNRAPEQAFRKYGCLAL